VTSLLRLSRCNACVDSTDSVNASSAPLKVFTGGRGIAE